ncbi:organic solute transporter subunit alpha-like isoform X2 [Artemia franciscana]|uniref:Uncharacterized protein n=1 Tax=Artemia franciscana TaxID=6661 RepID=A0AA88KWH0_ARTSF|nr:hypothetical protein QYM36_013561 [Artemia franciscana]
MFYCTAIQNNSNDKIDKRRQLYHGYKTEAFGIWGPAIYVVEGLIVLLTLSIYSYIGARTTIFAPSKRRTMILWVAATPLVMSTLSFVGILVPRANNGCNYVKTLFMPWVLMHLVNLTLNFHGGVNHLVPQLMRDKATLATCRPFCCCFGLYWKNVPYNKRTMRIVRALVYQVPLTQFLIVFAGHVLEQSGLYTVGYIGPDDSYLWLSLLNFTTFLFAMWGVNMIIAMSAERLAHIKYSKKIRMVQLLIIWIKSQTVLLAIIAGYGGFPCLLPNLSVKAYKNFVENSLIIGECFLISIPLAYEYRLRTGSYDRKDMMTKSSSTPSISTSVETIPQTPDGSIKDFYSRHPRLPRSVSNDEIMNLEFVAYC